MPFVLPPNIAIGSQEATNLLLQYQLGQASMEGVPDAPLVPMGYQQLTNAQLATVQALTVPAGATIAHIQNNGSQRCRWRDDGVDPTATTGRVISPDDTEIYDAALASVKIIRGGDGVTLDISYYKRGA